jgi:hypothetical protein
VIFQKHCVNKPWKAYITHNGECITIGYFATKEEAAEAYNPVARLAFGEGTILNGLDH